MGAGHLDLLVPPTSTSSSFAAGSLGWNSRAIRASSTTNGMLRATTFAAATVLGPTGVARMAPSNANGVCAAARAAASVTILAESFKQRDDVWVTLDIWCVV